jgi:PKD repeat protein
MDLRELFRKKLGNAEVTPDSSVAGSLMRKVALREFLHFNPARFNIYYLGAILGSLISAAILLNPVDDKQDQSTPPDLSVEMMRPSVDRSIAVPGADTSIQNQGKRDLNSTLVKSDNNIGTISRRTQPEKGTDPKVVSRENPVIIPANVSDSFSKKGLFPLNSDDMNKLQSGNKSEELLFELSATEGCAPLKLSFSIKSASYDSCKWTFGDGGYSYEKNPEWIYDVEGDYNVVLNLFASDGSQAVSATTIYVHPRPVARFEVSPEDALMPKNEIRINNYSSNAVKFRWDFGDGTYSDLFEPRHHYADFGSYNIKLAVTSDYGCSDSVIVTNAQSGSAYYIDFPNAFIPNIQGPSGGYYSTKSDEAAQVFHPVSSGIGEYQLKIFSKLGIEIFESSDINLGWDGYFKGQLCEPGVYIWKVRGSYLNGEPFTKMGDVTLLKQ